MGLHQRVPFERVIRQGDALRGGLGRVQRGIGLLDQGSGAQSATLGRVGDAHGAVARGAVFGAAQ